MATALDKQIAKKVDAFVAEITKLAQQAALETLSSALGGRVGNGAAVVARRGGRPPGAKRPPGELVAVQGKLAAHIGSHPGQRMEQIGKALGFKTSELTLPMKKLIASKKVKTKGHKRSRQYFPAK